MAGYDIPVSISAASTTSLPISFNTPTVFNFASPYASGGTSGSQADPYQPATAVSSASNGAPATSSLGGVGGSAGAAVSGSSSKLPMLAGLALVGLAAWWLIKRKGGK